MLPRCGADSRPRTRGASLVPLAERPWQALPSAHEGREHERALANLTGRLSSAYGGAGLLT